MGGAVALVLGELSILGADGQARPVPGVARRRALGHLALAAPGGASVDGLIETIWPEDRPSTHRAALRNTVSWLRHQFGVPDGIERSNEGYRLTDGIEVDAWRFADAVQRARRVDDLEHRARILDDALSHWRGDPYSGLDGSQFVTERQRLLLLRLEATQRLHETLERLGRIGDGLHWVVSALEDHPHHEGLTESLMRTLYATGDQVAALAVYEELRRHLREEFGLLPSPVLEDLQLAILHHRTMPLADPAPQPVEPTTPVGPDIRGVVSTTLAATRDRGSDAGPSLLEARADALSALDLFSEALELYLAAIDRVVAEGDARRAGALALRLGEVTWAPDSARLVAARIDAVLVALGDTLPVLSAELRLCRDGGLFRSGVEGTIVADPAAMLADLDTVRHRDGADQVAWAITRARNGLAGWLSPDEALALTAEATVVAGNDPLTGGHCDRARFTDALRAGRPGLALLTLRAMQRADDADLAVNRFGVVAATTCWQLATGRFESARLSLAAATEFQGRLGAHTLDQVLLGQSFWLTREFGDPAAIAAHLDGARALAETDETSPIWLGAAALLAADAERFGDLAEILAQAHEQFDLGNLPWGSHRLPTVAVLAEALAVGRLRGALPADPELAAALLAAVTDTDDRGVMVGWPTLYLGSSRRFVGFARLAVGDVGGAVEEFRRAVHADRWFPPLRARSQAGLELALSVAR